VTAVLEQARDVSEVTGGFAAAAERLQAAVRRASRGLVGREVLVEVIALSAVAGEHVLVIGEPGTAKSEAVRRVARALGGRYFEYLLGRFTEPSEIFGPIDLVKLQQGRFETVTSGMLPEAEIAFLDEVFLGSTAILNTLLGILNERQFRRGASAAPVPLKICVAASNALPEDPSLAAFADRFLTRVFVKPVPDSELEELLAQGALGAPPGGGASLDDLALLGDARRSVDLAPVRPLLAEAVRLLRRAGVALTDRRIVRSQHLISAAAVIAARRVATPRDLWPLVYAVPSELEQETAREVLRELLTASESPLGAAALDASASAAAQAARIAEAAREALAESPAPEAREGWLLRLEGLLRDIDATFSPEALPEPLPELRQRLKELVERGAPERATAQ
jgi:MoxR-like ATPase